MWHIRYGYPIGVREGTGWLHFRRVGNLRQQSQSQVLQIDARRTQTVGKRSPRLGADHGNSGALPRSRKGIRMRPLRVLFIRLAELFRKGPREHDLTAEMESHLQMHIEDNLRAGMLAVEA